MKTIQNAENANQETKQTSTTTTTVHESKHFPFQVVEITTRNNEDPTPFEEKQFKVGMCGQFVSEKVFATHEKAEKYIASRPWELITNMVCITFKNAIEYEKSKFKH